MHGIIASVYTIDSTAENKGIPYGVFTLYDVRLSPTEQIVRNVPAMGLGGHFNSSTTLPWDGLPNYGVTGTVEKPLDSVHNVEETPYVINQPVIIMFLGNIEDNPIIIGPAPCSDSGYGQTTAGYPKKYGSFQGASWSINKNGSVELDIPTTQNLTIKVDGKILCYITDSTIDFGADDTSDGTLGTEKTIMGEVFQVYMQSLVSLLNNHTHDAGTLVAPGGGGAVTGVTGGSTSDPFSEPGSDSYTTKVKVK
jgi:hypothetical protein